MWRGRCVPGGRRGGLVVGAERVLPVGEGVAGPLVDVEFDVLPHAAQFLTEGLDGVGREEVVDGGEVALDLGRQARPVGRPIAEGRPVERRGGRHPVALPGGDQQRQHPAHAEAAHAHGVAGRGLVGQQVVDGARHVAGCPVGRQRGHQLAGLVHLGVLGELAAVEVGCEGGEALACQLVADTLDLGHQPPPLLEHQHPRSAALRHGQVAGSARPVDRKLDHRTTHRALLP